MENISRSTNSIKNIVSGISGQIISTVSNFISRTIFIKILGITYLGVSGLFGNILSILSLAELGISNAIIYSMYKPISENDKTTIAGLMNLYKKAYTIIGISIAIIGASLIPFLNFIIKDSPNVPNLKVIYILYLSNTVISYFFTYKRSIIIANQKEYIVTLYHYIFNFIQVLVQILILMISHNFILYLLLQILFTFITNISISIKADKLYPYLKDLDDYNLDKKSKSLIFNNIRSLFLYKIGGVILTGTDNIIISKFIGVSSIGIVSNYNLLIGTIQTLTSKIFSGITASIGSFNVKETPENKEFIFRVLNFFSFWLFSFCSICFWILCNPFIKIWLGGEEYILSNSILFILILNFYIYGMQNTNWIFRDTMGLFKNSKYVPLIASVLNLIISIVFAKKFGLVGVFWGTVISRLLTGIWFDPYIIYKHVFINTSIIKYYINYIVNFLVMFAVGILTNFIANTLFIQDHIGDFIGRICLCLIIPNIIYYFLFRDKEEYKFLFNKSRVILERLIS